MDAKPICLSFELPKGRWGRGEVAVVLCIYNRGLDQKGHLTGLKMFSVEEGWPSMQELQGSAHSTQ